MDSLFNFEFYPTHLSMFPSEIIDREKIRIAKKIANTRMKNKILRKKKK